MFLQPISETAMLLSGSQVMCFRKLQSWNLSTSAAEFCSFQKSGEISREESQFVEAFKGEIEIPPVIPNWLWQVCSSYLLKP